MQIAAAVPRNCNEEAEIATTKFLNLGLQYVYHTLKAQIQNTDVLTAKELANENRGVCWGFGLWALGFGRVLLFCWMMYEHLFPILAKVARKILYVLIALLVK
jgi:hypothetical protein